MAAPLKPYSSRMWSQIKSDFLEFFDLHKGSGWVKAFLLPVIGLVVTYLATGADLLSSVIVFVIVGVVSAVIVGIYYVLAAPGKLDKVAQTLVVEKQRALEALELQRKPRLELLHGTGSSYQMTQPFYVIESVNMLETRPAGNETIHRVAVHNLSPTDSIMDLSLELTAIEPDIMKFLPVPLTAMHPHTDQIAKPSETKFFNVMSHFSFDPGFSSEAPQRHKFQIHHTIKAISTLVPEALYTITLTARGSNTPPVHRKFRFGINKQYKYFFEPFDESPPSEAQHLAPAK